MVAAGTIALSAGLGAVAQAEPTPPIPSYQSNGYAPQWTPRNGLHSRVINVDITSPASGCIVINRGGGDVKVAATGVGMRAGQAVASVGLNMIDPTGAVKARTNLYRTTQGRYEGAAHLAAANRPGNWSAVITAVLRGTNSSRTLFESTDVCVQRNAYAGYIRVTDSTPYAGQRITLSSDFMGLNANGKAYSAKPDRTMKLVRKDGAGWAHVATVKTNSRGRASVTLKFTGEAEYAFTYGGSRDFAPFGSSSITVG